RKELLEGKHLAEHRRSLGERQRGRRHQRTIRRGQYLMDAMAEFMRERHHVARLAHIVEQYIGMRRRYSRMRKGARLFSGADRRIDPTLPEKLVRHLSHPRRES